MVTLIDVTDPRFSTAENSDVLAFVRRTNPFAHSDVGSVLLSLGKAIPGAHAYCPSFKSCAYVVLHSESSRIFAIAYGQRGLAFRLAPASRERALADGGTAAAEIGPDWVAFAAWGSAEQRTRLERWSAQAMADALDQYLADG